MANSKVAALEATLAARSVEQVQLRRHLHAARQALDPHIIQARRRPRPLPYELQDLMFARRPGVSSEAICGAGAPVMLRSPALADALHGRLTACGVRVRPP